MLTMLRVGIEWIAGERDDAPTWFFGVSGWFLRCCAWAAAIVLIYAFSGQSSKFIYIDF